MAFAEDKRDDAVDLIIRQWPGRAERHGTLDIVEQSLSPHERRGARSAAGSIKNAAISIQAS